MVKLISQKRVGTGGRRIVLPPQVVRATIPVREALAAAGADIEPLDNGSVCVTVGEGVRMPAGIVAVHINEPPHVALRLECEPPWDGESQDFWQSVEWTACPKCGARLVWWEAGFVPGYRVCAAKPHHHWIVA